MFQSIRSESVSPKRKVLVSGKTRHVPEFVRQLNEWQYMERTLHRLMAAWGRHHGEIGDKTALHRHVWDQAEVIRRLRDRIEQFPGGKPDDSVHPAFEKLADCALFAPTFQDALDAIYHHLLRALIRAYAEHVQSAHPIHDAPTIALLHEINTIKEQHYFWYRDYRRRNPHTIDPAYLGNLELEMAAVRHFCEPMPMEREGRAGLCGTRTGFFMPRLSARPKGWRSLYDLMPYLSADFSESVEARRLFWGIGYLRELGLPDEQLKWLYYGHAMPWAWHHDISRHLWDESRHGLSGYSRLADWGIGLSDVGLPDGCLIRKFPEGSPLIDRVLNPFVDEDEVNPLEKGTPLSPRDLYEAVFHIGMIAENGHFIVKNEAYADFREGEDYESAEMMLFDIIDETTHVQYAHRWLPLLAEKAGIDNSGYRDRAAKIRAEKQANEIRNVAEAKLLPRDAGFGPWDHYQELLQRVRKSTPLKVGFKAPTRSHKPM